MTAPDKPMPPPCLHCRKPARLTNGRDVYPHRPDLYSKAFWVCDACKASCGCHPGSTTPLGFPADKATRNARMKLHDLRLDPLWKQAPKGKRKKARAAAYQIISESLGLAGRETHTGMFTLDQCRQAWKALEGLTTERLLER